MDDATFALLYCFGTPLIPLLIGIAGLLIARKRSPTRYRFFLAAINIYAMTVLPPFIIMEPDVLYTVLALSIIVILTAPLNLLAERRQPEQGEKWKLALPLLLSWLVWSSVTLLLNNHFFAGQYAMEYGALVFVPVLIYVTPLFFFTGLISVTQLLRLSNKGLRQSADSGISDDYSGARDRTNHPSLSVLDIVQLSSGYHKPDEPQDHAESH